MPLVRTTPVDPPARTHVWISGFTARGFQPGGTPELEIEYAACYQVPGSDPAVFEVGEHFAVTYTGQDAIDIFTEYSTEYAGMKAALYQILIDKGVEAGTIA